MTLPELKKPTVGRIIAGCAIAIGIAILLPLLLGMSSIAFPFTILTALVFAIGGVIPALVSAVACVTGFGVYYGTGGAIVALFAFALPSAVILRGLRWRMNFTAQMKQSVIAQLIGVLAALGAAYTLVGGNLIEALVNELRRTIETFPGIADLLIDRFYSVTDGQTLTILPEQLANGFLDASKRAYYLDALSKEIRSSLALIAPGTLLSASAVTGILAVAWPNMLIKRDNGESSKTVSIPMVEWYIPYQIVTSLLVVLAASYLLYVLDFENGDIVCMSVQMLLMTLFKIAAVISMNRRFSQMQMPTWLRVVLIVASLLLLGDYLAYYGAASALFGVNGVFHQIQRIRNEKSEK